MPQRTTIGQAVRPPAYDPCNTKREAYDIPGRIADLVNCYIVIAGKYIEAYSVVILVGLIVIVIMLIAAHEFIKE